jgi:hypothetical protein
MRPLTNVIQIPPLRNAAHRSGRNDNVELRHFGRKVPPNVISSEAELRNLAACNVNCTQSR